jgi:hypothetical protein
MPEKHTGPDLLVQRPREKPVFVFQGKTLEVERYSDLGNGVYWFVAEEMPEYGRENEEAHHG